MKTVQWLHSVKVPPNTDVQLTVTHQMQAMGEPWPYVVPEGYWLGITDATIQAKVSLIASYLVLHGVFAVPSHIGAFSFRTPIVLGPGTKIDAHLINNAGIEQWMNASVQGLLVEKTSDDYREAFVGLFKGAP